MNGNIRINALVIMLFVGLCFFSCNQPETKETKRPNILFIPVDDLRPELGCYGNTIIKTPNIDRLAKGGVTFLRAYCQQAVCNPSRASLLTGLRPDTLQVWDLRTELRDNLPDVVTLPQFFKNKGYTTVGIGKTFHNTFPDTLSWTSKPHIDGFPFDPDAVYTNEENLAIQEQKIEDLKSKGRSSIDQLGYWYVKAKATEIGEGGDDAYFDGAQTTKAISLLQDLANDKKPFFLSVGYYRPHLPFNAPKKYWDLYDPSKIELADNSYMPKGSPQYAVHGDAELRNYVDFRDLPWPEDQVLNEQDQRHIKHGYYASVSYIDAQIGRLMDELERLGIAENTIIVLWGDHGWKLGEHNSWGKMSNFEIDTRVPMIFSGLGASAKGQKSNALTEFVDIYPTLLEMTGFEVPGYLHGRSLSTLLEDPSRIVKDAAYSQFLLGRFGPPRTREKERMGYSVRTENFRYTEWYAWDKVNKMPGEFLDSELYDHRTNHGENINVAHDNSYKNIKDKLAQYIDQQWFSE